MTDESRDELADRLQLIGLESRSYPHDVRPDAHLARQIEECNYMPGQTAANAVQGASPIDANTATLSPARQPEPTTQQQQQHLYQPSASMPAVHQDPTMACPVSPGNAAPAGHCVQQVPTPLPTFGVPTQLAPPDFDQWAKSLQAHSPDQQQWQQGSKQIDVPAQASSNLSAGPTMVQNTVLRHLAATATSLLTLGSAANRVASPTPSRASRGASTRTAPEPQMKPTVTPFSTYPGIAAPQATPAPCLKISPQAAGVAPGTAAQAMDQAILASQVTPLNLPAPGAQSVSTNLPAANTAAQSVNSIHGHFGPANSLPQQPLQDTTATNIAAVNSDLLGLGPGFVTPPPGLTAAPTPPLPNMHHHTHSHSSANAAMDPGLVGQNAAQTVRTPEQQHPASPSVGDMAAMMQKMMEVANAAAAAAKRAEEAAASLHERKSDYHSAASEHKQPVPKLKPLTKSNLQQHAKQQRSASPSPEAAQRNVDQSGARDDDAENEEANQSPGEWQLFADAKAGESIFQIVDQSNLAIGDILELAHGTPQSEAVTITKFGSVHLAAPLRFSHPAGTRIRRIIEGTGDRWRPPVAQVSAATQQTSAMAASTIDDDFEDHDSWSPREREHQRQRYKRKCREARANNAEIATPPGVYVSIKQPDRIDLSAWPTLPAVRSYLANLYQSWRVLTAGGDHAEWYLEKAEKAARGTEEQYKEAIEALRCDEPRYLTAEEKLGAELLRRFPETVQKEYAIVRSQRRQDKLPAFMGRQLLCWGLRKFSRDQIRDSNSARNSLNALRNSVKKGPPGRGQFPKLLQAVEENLCMESSGEMTEGEIRDILEDMFASVPDFDTQMQLYQEVPATERNSQNLLKRLRFLIDKDDEKQQRALQEQAFTQQLGTKERNQQGKHDEGKTPPGKSPPGDAGTSKTKELLSHKDRQISALAGQLKRAGQTPDFSAARRGRSQERSSDGRKGGGKGKEGGRSPSRGGSETRDCYNCGKKGHLS